MYNVYFLIIESRSGEVLAKDATFTLQLEYHNTYAKQTHHTEYDVLEYLMC